MQACMHAWNYKITAGLDHAAGTDDTRWKHRDVAGGGVGAGERPGEPSRSFPPTRLAGSVSDAS